MRRGRGCEMMVGAGEARLKVKASEIMAIIYKNKIKKHTEAEKIVVGGGRGGGMVVGGGGDGEIVVGETKKKVKMVVVRWRRSFTGHGCGGSARRSGCGGKDRRRRRRPV